MNEEGYCVSVAAVRSVSSRLHTSSSASPLTEEKWEKVEGFALFFALSTHMHAQCANSVQFHTLKHRSPMYFTRTSVCYIPYF